jgi:tRNA G10  N-methylase Trm11
VAASSHPTLAAALARLGGVRADDVVWDPFVGAGTELIERALLGPYARLLGSDSDARALARAEENLRSAAVARWELFAADARYGQPEERPTLVLTNPPMGRRVLSGAQLSGLYGDFLARAAQILAPGGRLVWISARGGETAACALRLGLTVGLRRRVDMGGFWGELQVLEKPAT